MNLLHWAMHMLSYRCTVTAIKTASKVGTFVIVVLFACLPSGRRGNTKQVIARWHRLVASGVAMDMLHWSMAYTWLQRVRMAIKMTCQGGAFIRQSCLLHLE